MDLLQKLKIISTWRPADEADEGPHAEHPKMGILHLEALAEDWCLRLKTWKMGIQLYIDICTHICNTYIILMYIYIYIYTYGHIYIYKRHVCPGSNTDAQAEAALSLRLCLDGFSTGRLVFFTSPTFGQRVTWFGVKQ